LHVCFSSSYDSGKARRISIERALIYLPVFREMDLQTSATGATNHRIRRRQPSDG